MRFRKGCGAAPRFSAIGTTKWLGLGGLAHIEDTTGFALPARLLVAVGGAAVQTAAEGSRQET